MNEKTIAFIKNNEWEKAKEEAKISKWYRRHKKRANAVLDGFSI